MTNPLLNDTAGSRKRFWTTTLIRWAPYIAIVALIVYGIGEIRSINGRANEVKMALDAEYATLYCKYQFATRLPELSQKSIFCQTTFADRYEGHYSFTINENYSVFFDVDVHSTEPPRDFIPYATLHAEDGSRYEIIGPRDPIGFDEAARIIAGK